MKTISVINHKGGVGKTTLTANIGGRLARDGYRVLLVDCDPQGSLTRQFLNQEESSRYEKMLHVSEIFRDESTDISQSVVHPVTVNDALKKTGSRGLVSLVPADEQMRKTKMRNNFTLFPLLNFNQPSPSRLTNIFLSLISEYYEKEGRQSEIPADILSIYLTVLNNFKKYSGYDVILIDCNPGLEIMELMSFAASDYLLIPVKPSDSTDRSIVSTHADLEKLKERLYDCSKKADIPIEKNPEIAGIVFTMYSMNFSYAQETAEKIIRDACDSLNLRIFNSVIREGKADVTQEKHDLVPITCKYKSYVSNKDLFIDLSNFIDVFKTRIGL